MPIYLNLAYDILNGCFESADVYKNLYIEVDDFRVECKTLLKKLREYETVYLQYYDYDQVSNTEKI